MKILSIIALFVVPLMTQSEEPLTSEAQAAEHILNESLMKMRDYGSRVTYVKVHDCSQVIQLDDAEDDISSCLGAQNFLLELNKNFACYDRGSSPLAESDSDKEIAERMNDCIGRLEGMIIYVNRGLLARNFPQTYREMAGYYRYFDSQQTRLLLEDNINRMKAHRNFLMMRSLRLAN